MKKIIALVLALMMVLSLAACGGNGGAKKGGKTVGIAMPTQASERWIKDGANMKAQLEEKGYNPINQIVGYILSEDPTYITNHNNARTLIRKIDRDELLQVLVRKYLGQ